MMGFGMGFMWFGGFIFLLVIGLVIYLIVRLAGGSMKHENYYPHETQQEYSIRSLEILAERYARGEIGDEEYRQKKSDLTKYYR